MAWVGQTTGDNKFWILQRIFRGIEVQLRQTVPTDEIDRQVSWNQSAWYHTPKEAGMHKSICHMLR